MVTSLAGFAGSRRPHAPGGRIPIPALSDRLRRSRDAPGLLLDAPQWPSESFQGQSLCCFFRFAQGVAHIDEGDLWGQFALVPDVAKWVSCCILSKENRGLPKSPTGIQCLDEITQRGFPRGRPALICGSAGAGKTLLAMEFLIRGAMEYNEPGVLMAFEETAPALTQNVRSLGFDLNELAKEKKLVIDFVRMERSEIDETGDYDLEGLFIRLGAAIDAIGAKRVVLTRSKIYFAGLQNEGILRAESRRLFRWLKDRGVTAFVPAERGEGALTRHGLEEYTVGREGTGPRLVETSYSSWKS